MQSLEKLTIVNLDLNLKDLRKSESKAIADIILYLSELDKRKAYRELGYSSLFTYCTEALGYSEGSAYRRVQAARMLGTNPESYESIKRGKVTLCSIAEIAKVKDDEVKSALLKASEGKKKEEVKAMAALHLPVEQVKAESIKVKTVKREEGLFAQESGCEPKANILKYNFHVEVEEEFMRLYREAKEIIGHVPAAEVFRRCMSEFVAKRKINKRKAKPKSENEATRSRFIPKTVKVAVRERENGQCSFVSPDGKRCCERHGLEFDHKVPYAAGGSTDVGNLRMLCKTHNLLMAEKFFGKEKIQVAINGA